jgi:hypothetical protein
MSCQRQARAVYFASLCAFWRKFCARGTPCALFFFACGFDGTSVVYGCAAVKGKFLQVWLAALLSGAVAGVLQQKAGAVVLLGFCQSWQRKYK